MQTQPEWGVTAQPRGDMMGEKILMSYLLSRNETLRDVDGDVEAIASVLDALESIRRVFMELLLEAHGPFNFVSTPCDSEDSDDSDDSEDSEDSDDIF